MAVKNMRFELTVDTAAYAAGDVLTDVFKITDTGNDAELAQIVVFDASDQKADMRFYFFDTLPAATFTKNAAFALSDADLKKVCGWVDIAAADYTDLGSNAIARKAITNIGDAKYAIGVVAGAATPTYVAGELDVLLTSKR